MVFLVFVERHHDAIVANRDLQVDEDLADHWLEHVHPLVGHLRAEASVRVGGRERSNHVDRVLGVERQRRELTKSLEGEANTPCSGEVADTAKNWWKPCRYVEL